MSLEFPQGFSAFRLILGLVCQTPNTGNTEYHFHRGLLNIMTIAYGLISPVIEQHLPIVFSLH